MAPPIVEAARTGRRGSDPGAREGRRVSFEAARGFSFEKGAGFVPPGNPSGEPPQMAAMQSFDFDDQANFIDDRSYTSAVSQRCATPTPARDAGGGGSTSVLGTAMARGGAGGIQDPQVAMRLMAACAALHDDQYETASSCGARTPGGSFRKPRSLSITTNSSVEYRGSDVEASLGVSLQSSRP